MSWIPHFGCKTLQTHEGEPPPSVRLKASKSSRLQANLNLRRDCMLATGCKSEAAFRKIGGGDSAAENAGSPPHILFRKILRVKYAPVDSTSRPILPLARK
jgi:hypothetical protein